MSNGRYRAYPKYKDSGVEWVGQLPNDWEITRIKFCASLNSSKTELNHLPRETEVTFLPMEAIGEQGELDTSRTKMLSEVSSGYTYLAEGDVCIAKITPCFENGKGAIVRGLKNGLAFATTEVVPLRCQSGNTPEFLYYLLTSAPFNKQAEGSMYGAGGQKRVADSFVANYHFAKPPLPEQTQIAKFLDHETAKIDRLIEKQEELIRLLKEKRQAVISHAVTKGLNPHAPLKDSGIPWLGQVPAHWGVHKMGYAAKLRGGFAFSASDFGTEGIVVVRMNNLKRGKLDLSEAARIPRQACIEAAALSPGNLVWGMSGSIGETGSLGNYARVSAEDIPCQLNQRVGRFDPQASKLLTDYLEHLIQTPYFTEQILLLVTGTAQFNVSSEQVQSCIIAVPPLAEQEEIANNVSKEGKRFGQIIDEAQKGITLLQERRTALISAAVTGKIDVRHWWPREN